MKITEQEAADTLAVLEEIKDNEGDSDHIAGLNHAIEALEEEYGTLPAPTSEITEEVTENALDVLERGADEGIKEMRYQYRTVNLEAMYINGCLPDPRDWTARYHFPDGSTLEEDIESADSAASTIAKDGRLYDTGNKENNGDVVEVTVREIRDGIQRVSCRDCGLIEYTDNVNGLDIDWDEHDVWLSRTTEVQIWNKIERISGVGDATIDNIEDELGWEGLKDIILGRADHDLSDIHGVGQSTADKIEKKLNGI